MKDLSLNYLLSICLLWLIAYHSAYGFGEDNLFGYLRRADHSAEITYHFSRVNNYEAVTEPIFYVERYDDTSKIIVGFNNIIIFGKLQNDHHYVVTVNEDLNENINDIPSYFLDATDSGELYEVITLKSTTTTTSTTPYPRFAETLPDKQSLSEYLLQVGLNFSRLANDSE